VKVHRFFPNEKVPKDENGNPIWIKNNELLASENHPDSARLQSYKCLKFDEKSGRCLEYEKRPDICRTSGCVDENSDEDPEIQFERASKEKFYRIKNIKQ